MLRVLFAEGELPAVEAEGLEGLRRAAGRFPPERDLEELGETAEEHVFEVDGSGTMVTMRIGD